MSTLTREQVEELERTANKYGYMTMPGVQKLVARVAELEGENAQTGEYLTTVTTRALEAEACCEKLRKALEEPLQAILDGSFVEINHGTDEGTKEPYAFICVENSDFEPDNAASPNLVIDVAATLAALAESGK